MNCCADDHTEIWYEEDKCPLCKLRDELQLKIDENEALKQQIFIAREFRTYGN